MTTNYFNTFITVSPDSSVESGRKPEKAETVAGILYGLLREQAYAWTSDNLLFEVHARRNGLSDADRAREKEAFLSRPHACLRASPLVKQYGWGLHHDADGKVAMYGVETAEYRQLASRADLKVIAGIRSRRAAPAK